MANWFQSRQVRAGGYSASYILVFVAILAAVNYLSVQYNKTYDATELKLYSLSDQTLTTLDNLESEVTLYYFDETTRFGLARNSLVRYENASNRVNVRYIDPDAEPAVTRAMNIRSLGTTVVEVGASRSEAPSFSEEDITNTIIKAVKGEVKSACFLTGHGEAAIEDPDRLGFSGAASEVQSANYSAREISLLESPEIPSDCGVLVVAGPTASFVEPEVDLLRTYVDGGGRLLLMLDYDSNSGLEDLAANWGIEIHEDLIIDQSGIGQLLGAGPLTPLVNQYDVAHPITRVMGNIATFFPLTRSVTTTTDAPGWSSVALALTSADAFATSDFVIENGELKLSETAQMTAGPITVAAASSFDIDTPEEGAETAPQGRVVVTGTSLFVRNAALARGANRDLLLNSLNWLTSDEDLISIRPNDPESTPIDLSTADAIGLLVGLVLVLPLLIVVAGVRTWWVRR
jgi:ABC-type uncharacterized transport system involved in gliding motility auxiliary subunit